MVAYTSQLEKLYVRYRHYICCSSFVRVLVSNHGYMRMFSVLNLWP